MANIDARISLQRSRFNLIQEAADFTEQDIPPFNRQLITTRLTLLEQNWNRFQEEHENLCLSENLSHQPYEELDSVGQSSGSAHSEQGAVRSLLPRSALPRIKLPNFSGEYHSWRTFHDLFVSLIKVNSDLTNVEKMHYLKTCLTGEAARLICNLPLSGDSFAIPWNLLLSRYENKRFLISAQLDRIANLKPLETKSANGLRTLLTTILEAIGALRALDCSVHNWDPLLIHQFTRLLDSESREAWEVKLGSSPTFPTFSQFEEFLSGRTRAMENLQPNLASGSNKEPFSNNSRKPRAGFAAYTTMPHSDNSSLNCPLCGAAHYVAKCDRFQSKALKQRREIIIKHKRCFNCLGSHNNTYSPRYEPSLTAGPNGDNQIVRLLIDQGSEMSFVTEDLVRRLKLPRTAASIPLIGIGGTHSGRTRGMVTINLRSIHDSTSECKINTYILPKLTNKLPPFRKDNQFWPHIAGLQLADPDFSSPGLIHIIIGADNYGSVIQPGLIRGNKSSPIAQQTIFGWVLSGSVSENVTHSVQTYHCTADLDLQDLLARFWTQEELSTPTSTVRTEDEEECERHFLSTHKRDTTGRYVVRLPFKSDPALLGESKIKALRCLNSQFNRFSANPAFYKLYDDFLNEYINLGHMVLVNNVKETTTP
ncbi:PREDICTED: uncharacterized protein LOC105568900, partial [Vollenhovia emeryi]|uniref:uncharacterized protein LOC105568900 n=1 Tax=Vollenhovia emeryi TaxID=411798 RepID=UPI0005F53A06